MTDTGDTEALKKKKKEILFIYLAVPGVSCGTQDLHCGMHVGSSSLTRD